MCTNICLSFSMIPMVVQLEVGDRVVALTAAPVMSGAEKLAEVDAGTELTVDDMRGPWVRVEVAGDGRNIVGWLLSRHLVPTSKISLKQLSQSGLVAAERAEEGFTEMDTERFLATKDIRSSPVLGYRQKAKKGSR